MTDIKQLCTFMLGDLWLGIGAEEVHEILPEHPLTPVPLADSVIIGLINMRGQIVSVVDLRRVFDLPPLATDARPPFHVVVRRGQELISLLVDRVGDVLEVDASLFASPPDTAPPKTRELFRGTYQLPDRLLLVFDTHKSLDAIVARAAGSLSVAD